MRWLALGGAILFAYLALFPAGLLISTVDSACSGVDCDQPLVQDIVLGILYVTCFATVMGSAATMAVYFLRPSVGRERLIRRALVATLVAIAATLFAQFAITFPLAALFTLGVGGSVYGTLRYLNPARTDDPPDYSSNGHEKLNGHPG